MDAPFFPARFILVILDLWCLHYPANSQVFLRLLCLCTFVTFDMHSEGRLLTSSQLRWYLGLLENCLFEFFHSWFILGCNLTYFCLLWVLGTKINTQQWGCPCSVHEKHSVLHVVYLCIKEKTNLKSLCVSLISQLYSLSKSGSLCGMCFNVFEMSSKNTFLYSPFLLHFW